MSKSKKLKGKKSVPQEVESVDPDARQVTLSLVLERRQAASGSSWDAITSTIVASAHLCGQRHVAVLSDMLAQATLASTADGVAASDLENQDTLEIPLMHHRVHVTSVESLRTMANGTGGEPHRVELHTLTTPLCSKSAEDEVAAGGAGAGTASSLKAKKPAKPKAAKKGQSAQDAAPPPVGDRLASVSFNACDLLTERTIRIPVDVDREKCAAAVAACWVQLSAGDTSLIDSADSLRALRPVFFSVHSLEHLPSVPESAPPSHGSAEQQGELACASTAETESRPSLMDLRVEWGTHHFHVPVRGQRAATSHPAAVLEPSLCQSVLFLCDIAPFDAYRQAFHEPVRVSLVYTDPSHNQLTMGSGTLSVRDLVTDDQSFFAGAVQLLPQRSSFSTGESCLTAGTTTNVTVDFMLPLPPVVHVSESGLECAQGQFLTRAVLVMPYDAAWAEAVLRLLIEEMKRCPRATLDAHAYVEPPVEETGSAAGRLSVVDAPTSTTTPASVPAGKEKTERSSRRGLQSHPSTPPPLVPATASSPYLTSSIKVVSPNGVSGFEVSDGLLRVLCLEGTVREVHAILEGAAAAAQYDPGLRILLNSELFTPQRFYLTFPPLVTPPECTAANRTSTQTQSHSQDAKGLPLTTAPPAANTTQAPGAAGKYEVAEAGGTGGRIHRIRLSQPLEQLVKQQKYLLKRTLSASCLSAFQRLSQLTHCDSLIEAVNRAVFPSAADIISLERSFGRTLDVFDIFGRQEYDPAQMAKQATLPATSPVTSGAITTALTTSTVNPQATPVDTLSVELACLQRKDVGRLAAFTGTLLLGRLRAVSEAVLQRFRKAQWMITDDGVEVLCVFTHRTPSGTIRYHVEGQVVACGEDMALYVLDFQTRAQSWTDSHNPTYEAFLKARARRAKWAAAPGSRSVGFPHSSAHTRGHTGATVPHRSALSAESSDDDNDADSPPSMSADQDQGHSHSRLCPSARAERAAPRCDLGEPKLTRSARLRAKANADMVQPTVSDEVLWQLYNKRAPHTTAASSSSTPADRKQPREVMRF